MSIIDREQLSIEVPHELEDLINAYNLTPHDNEDREKILTSILEHLENLELSEQDIEQARDDIHDMINDEHSFRPW